MSDKETIEVELSPEDIDKRERKRQNQIEALNRGRATRLANLRTKAAHVREPVRGVAAAREMEPPAEAKAAHRPRDEVVDEPITRKRRDERLLNAFDLPARYKKPGWDYEYKVIRVLAQPVDSGEMQDHREAGWRPERAKDWPTLCDPDASPDSPIERGGQRLYGRPLRLTQEAKTEDYQAANAQQRDRMMAAATGQSAMQGHGGVGSARGVRPIPVEIQIEGIGGGGTGRGS